MIGKGAGIDRVPEDRSFTARHAAGFRALPSRLRACQDVHGISGALTHHGHMLRSMNRQIISTENAPSSPLYSQGVRVGSTIYVSGMVGIDSATGELAGSSIQDQTRQALRNCEAILHAGGSALADVTLVTVLLAQPDEFAGMNEAYSEVFGQVPPARAVARLGPDLRGILVSILMTAHTDS